MKSNFFFGFLLFSICSSCSPTNIKIVSNPKKIGYKRNESILITPISGVSEVENEQLMSWANEALKGRFPIQPLNYWDVEYKSSQFDCVMPSYNSYDTAKLGQLIEKLDVHFILLSTLNKVNENNENELQNPNYKTREALVRFQLLDLKTKMVVWHCTTRVFANPFRIHEGGSQYHSVNILSGSFAVNKAYKESVNRLMKGLTIID